MNGNDCGDQGSRTCEKNQQENLTKMQPGKVTVRNKWTQLRGSVGFPGGASGKQPPANAGDTGEGGLTPGWGRSPGGGRGTPRQHSCLENPMDREAWRATVHGVAKSWTRLK